MDSYIRPNNFTFHIIDFPKLSKLGFSLRDIHPRNSWPRRRSNDENSLFYVDHMSADPDDTNLWIMHRDHRVATKFVHNDTAESFVVVLGINDWTVRSEVWSDIVLDPGSETLKQICDSYDDTDSDRRKHGRDVCLDRISRTLKDGRLARVQIIKQCEMDKRELQYVALLDVYRPQPGFGGPPTSSGDIQQQASKLTYIYAVTAHLPSDNGLPIRVTEFFPESRWNTKGERWRLSMYPGVTCGILMFRDENTNEKFAVVLGVRDSRPWMDIVTNCGEKKAQVVSHFYSRGGRRGEKPLENLLSMQDSLRSGQIVSAETRVGRPEYLGEDELMFTDIKVN